MTKEQSWPLSQAERFIREKLNAQLWEDFMEWMVGRTNAENSALHRMRSLERLTTLMLAYTLERQQRLADLRGFKELEEAGIESKVEEVKRWCEEINKGDPRRVLVWEGPPFSGKTIGLMRALEVLEEKGPVLWFSGWALREYAAEVIEDEGVEIAELRLKALEEKVGELLWGLDERGGVLFWDGPSNVMGIPDQQMKVVIEIDTALWWSGGDAPGRLPVVLGVRDNFYPTGRTFRYDGGWATRVVDWDEVRSWPNERRRQWLEKVVAEVFVGIPGTYRDEWARVLGVWAIGDRRVREEGQGTLKEWLMSHYERYHQWIPEEERGRMSWGSIGPCVGKVCSFTGLRPVRWQVDKEARRKDWRWDERALVLRDIFGMYVEEFHPGLAEALVGEGNR